MKTHTIIPFIRYLLKKAFGGVIELYESYDTIIANSDASSILLTLLLALASFIIVLPVAWLSGFEQYTGWGWIGAAIIISLNHVRIVLREQYNIFLEERQRLFEMLKD